MPPLYHRVWQYLKYKANHEEATIQLKGGGFLTIMPGQHLTSLKTIAHDVGWMERGKFFEPNKKTISTILSWLKEKEMIDFRPVTSNGGRGTFGNGVGNGESNAFGTLITLINWATYQLLSDQSNGISNEESNGSKPLPGSITIINNKKIAATAGAHARDFINLQTESQEILRTPHAQVEEEYLMLHCRHFSSKDWQTLSDLFAAGIPHTKVISYMREIYAARSQHTRINSFSYYDQSIREEWDKERARELAAETSAPEPSQTTPVPSGTVAKGQVLQPHPSQYFVLDENDPITQLMRKAEQAYAQHGTS